MIPKGEYVSLEGAIASLRRESPEVLKGIAKNINSADPHAEFNRETITSSKYGSSIPGFAITYGQLGAYLNLAVSKYASVLIETEIGAVESAYVAVNLEWLARQHESAARQPEVAREIAMRSCVSKGTTVSPIQPWLEDQDPEAALAELRKLNIRIERHLVMRHDDGRDAEIERLLGLLEASNAERVAEAVEKNALAKMVKVLTIENDQLRKERAHPTPPPASSQPQKPERKPKKPTNVEIFNEESRASRAAIADLARTLWEHEDYSNHRTMDMVHVIRRMAESEPAWKIPETDEVLARWLSEDAAPAFAKRPGRPRKEKPKK